MTTPTGNPTDRIAEIRARWINPPDGSVRTYVDLVEWAHEDIPWLLDEVGRLQGQIGATRQMLRIECAEYDDNDDNDWPDDLHLADVVEKDLARSARAEIERLRDLLNQPPTDPPVVL